MLSRPLSPAEQELLNFCQQMFVVNSSWPTHQSVVDEGIYDSTEEVAEVFDSPVFNEALRLRGLPVSSVPIGTGAKPRHAITAEQLAAVELMLNFTDKRSRAKKLAHLSVTPATWDSWKNDPAFQQYMNARAAQVLNNSQAEIDMALVDKAISGDVKAIEYVNLMTGRFVPKAPALESGPDVTTIVNQVLQIVYRNVTDPRALQAIADEMRALAEPTGITTPAQVNARQPVLEGSLAV